MPERPKRRRPLPQQPADSYEQFSEIYDLLGFHRFSRLSLEKTRDFLGHTGLRVSRLLDLACGTGHYAIAISKLGVHVEGVDASMGMLDRARHNAHRLRGGPVWTRGTFTDFSVAGKFELVTCWFDSLNHLTTDAELLACFRRVRARLAPSGAFLFDVNTPAGFRERWPMSQYRSRQSYAVHTQGMAVPGSEFAVLQLEAFVRRGRAWQRYKLPFVQRGLTPEILEPLLRRARFRDITFEPFDAGDRLEEAGRILVAARN